MARLAIQTSPAGLPVDPETQTALEEADFIRREDGTFLSNGIHEDAWVLVSEFTNQHPTIQALHLDDGGVIFWYSAYHMDTAMFEYKRSGLSVPSRINSYAAKA